MKRKKKKKSTPIREKKREFLALFLLFFSLFLLLALISTELNLGVLGSLAPLIAESLSLVIGKAVAFLLVLLLAFWAVRLFVVERVRKPAYHLAALILMVVALSTLCSLPFAQTGQDEHMLRYGGLLGAFFLNPQGLAVPLYLGNVGCLLLFTFVLLVSFTMLTNVLPSRLFMITVSVPLALVPQVRQKFLKRRSLFRSRASGRVLSNELQRASSVATAAPQIVDKISPAPSAPQIESADEWEEEVVEVSEPRRPSRRKQQELAFTQDYSLPPLSLLGDPPAQEAKASREELLELSESIERTLADYNIQAKVSKVTQGPVVTLFELQPAPGTKLAKILSLERDLTMALKARSIRIVAPIPGKAAVGIEVPNRRPSIVYLKEILQSEELKNHASPLAFALGKTIAGDPYVADLAEMPHLLIAGATGAGKSVCINSIISCFLLRQPPDRVKFILIDPKRVELNVYREIPHLLVPVIFENKKAAAVLAWAVELMEDRYKTLVRFGVRNIDGYNRLALSSPPTEEPHYMPPIVIIIDELADLMVIARNEVEESIIRLSQLARAVGIHLVIATQRPSVNVITGIIKANFPYRIAFRVSSKVDSRTILDANGAEALLGRGDMLYGPGGAHRPVRVQGAYLSDPEVEQLVTYIRNQAPPQYSAEDFDLSGEKGRHDEGIPASARRRAGGPSAPGLGEDDDEPIDDELYNQALRIILESGKASASLVQRRLRIGYVRASRLMEMMEAAGIVGPPKGSKPREILIDPIDYLNRLRQKEGQ